MASIKKLKRDFNYAIFDIVEEAFDQQHYGDKSPEVTNKIIDEVVDYRNTIITKINAASTKKEYAELRKEIAESVEKYATKLM